MRRFVFLLAWIPLATSGTSVAQEATTFSELATVDVVELTDMRGRNNGDAESSSANTTVMAVQQLEATVNGASFNVGEMNNGSVDIGEHALENFSGVGLFNFVTGNNNAVNASIGIAINLE